MIGILKFDLEAAERVAEHALSATEHRPNFEDYTNPAYLKSGRKMPESGLMNPEDVDTSKIPPAIWLVKDHGVYLMSNGLPGNGEKSPVVYAEEMDPDSNPDDWYVRAEAVFGGDDCCIALSADIPANVRRANPDGKHLKLSITPGAVMVLCG